MAGHDLLHGFPPVSAADARILILGSMPGRASLDAGRYYAHPRNHFWPIVGAVLGFAPDLEYTERAARLIEHRIALWDVLRNCKREGSLDSAIDRTSLVPNDFAAFFAEHREIESIVFNGAAAESLYLRHVWHNGVRYYRMPSTSPANATYTFQQKLEAWCSVLAGGSEWPR